MPAFSILYSLPAFLKCALKYVILDVHMEEYETLAQTTRNLEQEYIAQIIVKYNNRIKELQEQAEAIKSQHTVSPDGSKTIEELREEISRLEKQRSMDERKLREYENVIAGLRLSLAESTSQKHLTVGNNAAPGNEGIDELKRIQEEILKSLRQLVSSTEHRMSGLEERVCRSAADHGSVEVIKKLKSEIEVLQDKNEALQSNSKLLKEQKDNIILLKDSIENKDKIIESQRQQIQKLNEKLKRESVLPNPLHFEESPTNPFSDKENIEDPWALVAHKNEPVSRKKKEPKKGTAKAGERTVNVGNIIRDENKSFFNNLSFNNSSPVLEKKAKKKF